MSFENLYLINGVTINENLRGQALTLFIDSTSESAVGPMFAMSLLSLVPVFLFFVAFQRMLVEGINTSGIKG